MYVDFVTSKVPYLYIPITVMTVVATIVGGQVFDKCSKVGRVDRSKQVQ